MSALAILVLLGAAAKELPMPPPPAPKPAGGLKAIRVAVLEPAVDPSIDERAREALGLTLTAEVRKLEKVTAIAAEEIKQLVSFQRSRALMGCGEDTSCIAELVDALAADELVTMKVGLLGQTYSVALSRLDARQGKVTQTFARQVPRESVDVLLELIGPAVEALFPERPLAAGKTRGVDRVSSVRRGLPRWVFFATAGAGAAAGAGGGVMGYLAGQSHGRYRALANGSTTTMVEAAELDRLRRETESAALAANALFAAAGALALGAALEAAFTDWSDGRAAPVALAPAEGGFGIAVKF